MTELTVHSEEKVTIPTGERMMISTSDWSRVRQNVERLGESVFDRAATLGATLAGSGIALLGVIASIEAGTTKPSSGLLTGLWVSFGFCVLFAVVLIVIGLAEHRRYRTSNGAICADMDDVATRAGHDGLGQVDRRAPIGIKGWAKRIWDGTR